MQNLSKFNVIRERIYRKIAKYIVYIVYRAKFIGFEKIPEKGGALLISNHITYMDGLIINAAIKRPIRFIIDRNIYMWPGVHHFMSLYKAIPIEAKKESVAEALKQAKEALDNGELVFIFPEGQLTFTGNMSRFRFGIEWLVKNSPVPVYPMALGGLWGSIFSRKYRKARFKMIPRSFRRRVYALCGDPISPEDATVSNLQRVVMGLKNEVNKMKKGQ